MKNARYSAFLALALISSVSLFVLAQEMNVLDNILTVQSRRFSIENCHNLTLSSINCAETVTATFDNHGVLWIVWTHNNYLYLQSSTDRGKNFSPATRINTTPESIKARGENRPKIKLDQQGNIYLTWTKSLGKRFTSNIRFSYSKDHGETFSNPITINDNQLMIDHRLDSLAIGQKGEILITWLDNRDSYQARQVEEEYQGSSLYYSWSNNQGESFSGNKKIAGHTCQCCRLQTAIDQNNRPVIAWRHIFAEGTRDHALLKFNDWDNPGKVIRVTHENWKIDACPHHGTGLSIAEDNRYHLVWFSDSATHQGLFYGFSTDAGKTLANIINVVQHGGNHPDIIAIDQQVFIVWQQYDGKQTTIKLIRSNNGGETWNKAEIIAQVTTDKVDRPFLIKAGYQAYLSWQIPHHAYQLKRLN
jgi:hypothetical protein